MAWEFESPPGHQQKTRAADERLRLFRLISHPLTTHAPAQRFVMLSGRCEALGKKPGNRKERERPEGRAAGPQKSGRSPAQADAGQGKHGARSVASELHFLLDLAHEVRGGNAEGMGQRKDGGHAYGALSAFYAHDVDALQSGMVGKRLLGEVPFLPLAKKHGAYGRLEKRIGFHGSQVAANLTGKVYRSRHYKKKTVFRKITCR